MTKQIKAPTIDDLMGDDFFKTKSGKSLYAVVPYGYRVFMVAEIANESGMLESPNFRDTESLDTKVVMGRFAARTGLGTKIAYVKNIFGKYDYMC